MSAVRLHVQALAPGSEVAIAVGSGSERSYAVPASGTIDIAATFGAIDVLRLRVTRGELGFLGAGLTRWTRPSLTIDVFGIPGATIDGLANTDLRAVAAALAGPHIDAVWLEYGTNEAANAFDANAYETKLRSVLSALRAAFPMADCLLVGPPDRGLASADRGTAGRPGIALDDPRHNARIHDLVNAIQARVAPERGCAHWNWQAHMGGVGAHAHWGRMQPPGMARDRVHLTQDGYRESGQALAAALGWDLLR